MQLLDYYRTRFGQAVKHQGNGWNGPCPLCGGEPGKSDRFMVWPERKDNLGEVCSQHGIFGIWSCRQCGAGGDTIAYLTKIDGLTFREALGELGIEASRLPVRRRRPAPVEPLPAAWAPREISAPSAQWQEQAAKLVEKAAAAIWDFPPAIAWLGRRGIDEAAIRKFKIGYLGEESAKHHGLFRPRKSFGLAPKAGPDGQQRDRLFIPRGITIPTFGACGQLFNLRIRRHNSDLGENRPKYLELEGSARNSFFLRSSQPGHLAVYFVTEAELDAILIHHVSGGVAGAVAVRTNRGKPDARSHAAMACAVRVCVALDYDEAGAAGVGFWEETYQNFLRWPTPEGKDPGDACSLGVDMREWIGAALPASISLPENESAAHGGRITQPAPEIQAICENGQLDPCAAGQNSWEEGASPKPEDSEKCPSQARSRVHERALAPDFNNEVGRWQKTQPRPFQWASEGDFSNDELAAIEAALPEGMALTDIYLDVAVIWLLWRKIPITYIRHRDEAGNAAGFSWEFSHLWKSQHEALFDLFWRHQSTSRALWEWLSSMPHDKITARNLFDLWGSLAPEGENK